MEKDPGRRFATMLEFRDALENPAPDPPRPGRGAGGRRTRDRRLSQPAPEE